MTTILYREIVESLPVTFSPKLRRLLQYFLFYQEQLRSLLSPIFANDLTFYNEKLFQLLLALYQNNIQKNDNTLINLPLILNSGVSRHRPEGPIKHVKVRG